MVDKTDDVHGVQFREHDAASPVDNLPTEAMRVTARQVEKVLDHLRIAQNHGFPSPTKNANPWSDYTRTWIRAGGRMRTLPSRKTTDFPCRAP